MEHTQQNNQIGNATKPVEQKLDGLFAYSVSKGLVSKLSPIEMARITHPILTRHVLTNEQIREIGGAS